MGMPVTFKVGSELFLASGNSILKEIHSRKFKTFLDLKFHDIPTTVSKAANLVADFGVSMFTLHLMGGKNMIQDTRSILSAHTVKPKILGVSVLTSFSEEGWKATLSCVGEMPRNIETAVSRLVENGVKWGVDGVVCSSLELGMIRKKYPDLYTVVPGIRPKGFGAQDQSRVMTPCEAKDLGASAIVVGRPITQHEEPKKIIELILKDLQ